MEQHGDDEADLAIHAAPLDEDTTASSSSSSSSSASQQQQKRRDVVLMCSQPYFDALRLLPVHSSRELMTLALARALDLLQPGGLQCVAPARATRADLELFHTKAYIDALVKHSSASDTTAAEQEEQEELERLGLVDDAYAFPNMLQYCRYVAGASLTAADALLHLMRKQRSAGERVGMPVVINLGGGRHHAMRSKASGFCYVNDIVLSIHRLLQPRGGLALAGDSGVSSVLCIDMDVHHGDGTQEAFYFSDSVTTISFHLHERGFFPGTGAAGAQEHGAGRGRFRNVNVPLKRGITDATYSALFRRVVRHAVEQLQPQVLVLVCGVDTLSRDPLGGFNLTSAGVCECVESLLDCRLPLLLLGGGGYSGADASKCFAEVLATTLGVRESLPERIPEHEFYPEYGPDFRMSTSAVLHRPDQNTPAYLEEVVNRALETIDKAVQLQIEWEANRVVVNNKRKR